MPRFWKIKNPYLRLLAFLAFFPIMALMLLIIVVLGFAELQRRAFVELLYVLRSERQNIRETAAGAWGILTLKRNSK